MKWQPMKTAPRDGRLVMVTVLVGRGERVVVMDQYPYLTGYPAEAIAWARIVAPTPYTGTLEDLDAEGGDA